MTWSRAFPEPFILADGRKVENLYEAGQLVIGLPERNRANGILGPRDGTADGCGLSGSAQARAPVNVRKGQGASHRVGALSLTWAEWSLPEFVGTTDWTASVISNIALLSHDVGMS
jgi:hypothetical protein